MAPKRKNSQKARQNAEDDVESIQVSANLNVSKKFNFYLKEIERYKEKVKCVIDSKSSIELSQIKLILEDLDRNLSACYCESFDADLYDDYTVAKDDLLELFTKIQTFLTTQSSDSNVESKNLCIQNQNKALKLPKFELPNFSGDINEWISFKEIFSTSVLKNEDLSDLNKFQHLLSCSKGEALRLIKGYPVTGESLGHAWTVFENRFDNPRLLANNEVSKILNCKSLKSNQAKSILDVLDVLNEAKRNLENLNFEFNSLTEMMIIFILEKKLDEYLSRQWELTLDGKTSPTLNQFSQFLEKQGRSLQGVVNEKQKKLYPSQPRSVTLKATVQTTSDSCVLCQGKHLLHVCDKFLKMTVDERWCFVRKSKLCFNCLRLNHNVPSCKFTTTCRVCKMKHHTILHAFKSNQSQLAKPEVSPNPEISNETQTVCLNGHHLSNQNLILLPTAVIKVRDGQGKWMECRALLDSGSQTSLITESCSERLRLSTHPTSSTILGLDEKVASHVTRSVNLTFAANFSSQETFQVQALVVKKLSSNLPNFYFSDSSWPHIQGLKLADPCFHISRPIDVILGSDIFLDLIQSGSISGGRGQPSAINSKLGWLLSGKVSSSNQSYSSLHLINCHSLVDLGSLMNKFWEVESIPGESDRLDADEEKQVEELFVSQTTRNPDGRFVVKLPFKEDLTVGESKTVAQRRFFSLEKKLCRDPELKNQYTQFMREYQQLNHMQPIKSEDPGKSSRNFYLPHFGVLREQSETTKLRVVFDGSQKSDNGLSLNDILKNGPKLQNDLYDILLRFRTHRVALTGDIEKMFRQILINPSDIDFQRILWREEPEQPLGEFQLLTVTYGTVCAPYLAIRTLIALAKEEAEHFPEASKVTLEDFYVDDLLTGADNVEEAKTLLNQMIELMKKGGFPLRKWASNESSVLESLPPELRSSSGSLQIEEDHVIKILGIIWDASEDTFQIKISSTTEERITKRQLLSTIAKIYDPLGFLSPTTVQLKILMQDLWKESTSWDDPVSDRIFEAWTRFRNQMQYLAEIKIPRCLSTDATTGIQLIGFCDASQRAYAAVFYLRTESRSKGVQVSMITSKTKVAPVKPITLPRLELMSALLLSQLYVVVIESLRKVLQIDTVMLFSDSQIVLDWLQSSPGRWKTFVANRISKIQELTSEASWHHVRSQDNPADCASRGIPASRLKVHHLWWSGPQWLSQDGFQFPSIDSSISYEEDMRCEEKSSTAVSNVAITSTDNYLLSIAQKYSSFSHLIRVIAWCKRFINNCRASKVTSVLSSKEIEDATKAIIRAVQESEYQCEIQHLQKGDPLPKNSKLLPLSVFLDVDGIIKVGGRLKNSYLSPSQKHPVLLPKNHHVTKLIVLYYHQIHLHSGPLLTLCSIRQKFWIPSGRDVVSKILSKCLTCFRLRAHPDNQIMGDLPANRFNVGRAFINVGVDFAGPFLTKPNVPRSKIKIKSYIALFICFATKAVHLEVVSDLSTDAFLAAFRRFISRRGRPSNVFSDNGTNFKGASAHLKEQLKLVSSNNIQNFASQESITWHFNPPIAPHFGGLWEAGIKSAKQHLVKVMKSAILNFEELTTLVTQIEACLNSRPLTPLSSDPHDLEPLTPGHFLIGAPVTSFPEKAPSESLCLKKRWHLIQHLRNQFWNRWHKEYLSDLQQRTKWTKCKPNLQVDDLVLLKEDDLPPMKWNLGRVVQVFPGHDGVVRVVEIKCSRGLFKRPITKCCLLPKEF